MGRTLSPERQILKQWAIIYASLGMKQTAIAEYLGSDLKQSTINPWLKGAKIVVNQPFIIDKLGRIIHNSGIIIDNLSNGLPAPPEPKLFVGRAEDLNFLVDKSVDLIITSPPYNLGQEKWPMGGNGRTPREAGIGYSEHEDNMPESDYEAWQVQCLNEFYRVAKPGASLFYNHKVRQREGEIIHPVVWLKDKTVQWILRQEIIWDRISTHNHSAALFWPQDERIYWMTKGKPNLPDKSIGIPSVWQEFGPIPKPNGGHPAPFTPALPKRMTKKRFYACDLDLVLVDKFPYRIVAFTDYKKTFEKVTFSEVIAYNVLKQVAPVFIIRINNPESGGFRVSRFVDGDPTPNPPLWEETTVCKCETWEDLTAWEEQLRNK